MAPKTTNTPAVWRSWQHSSLLQIALWTLWTLAVGTAAYLNWHAAVRAHQRFQPLGMVIHCSTTGVIGLIAITLIEIWLEPERFLTESD